jgi:hypothetical protein
MKSVRLDPQTIVPREHRGQETWHANIRTRRSGTSWAVSETEQPGQRISMRSTRPCPALDQRDRMNRGSEFPSWSRIAIGKKPSSGTLFGAGASLSVWYTPPGPITISQLGTVAT